MESVEVVQNDLKRLLNVIELTLCNMNSHLAFSLVKSLLRIVGLLVVLKSLIPGIILLILAEALGVFEEIV